MEPRITRISRIKNNEETTENTEGSKVQGVRLFWEKCPKDPYGKAPSPNLRESRFVGRGPILRNREFHEL